MKFAVGFLVPHSTRIRRIASYYERDGRVIAIYDDVTLVVLVAVVTLLVVTGMDHLHAENSWPNIKLVDNMLVANRRLDG